MGWGGGGGRNSLATKFGSYTESDYYLATKVYENLDLEGIYRNILESIGKHPGYSTRDTRRRRLSLAGKTVILKNLEFYKTLVASHIDPVNAKSNSPHP